MWPWVDILQNWNIIFPQIRWKVFIYSLLSVSMFYFLLTFSDFFCFSFMVKSQMGICYNKVAVFEGLGNLLSAKKGLKLRFCYLIYLGAFMPYRPERLLAGSPQWEKLFFKSLKGSVKNIEILIELWPVDRLVLS